ncbi:MAG: hypothetical protein ACFFAN_08195 [Promethearchaeota archaeon]
MSIHGNQYILPLFIKKSIKSPSIYENEELALVFYLLTKNLKKGEKILSFSRLLWPLLSIQGVISTHIFLDGLAIFSKKGKFSNPPRQPLVGHFLRNIEEREKIELLNKIIEVLTYKDTEAEEIGVGEESEYQSLTVEGLINPEHLQSLKKLIPFIDYLPITDYTPLDTSLSTEQALNISERYRSILETMKGNVLRWETQTDLIGTEIKKWLIDLTVELKDIDMRYNSQITKIKEKFDDIQLNKQKDLEFDKIEQWNVMEKKNIIESVSILFKTAERQLQEIIKKNRFFSDDESLKSRVFEDLLLQFESNFTYLKEEGQKFINTVENLYQKFNLLKEQAQKIDAETAEKLNNATNELNMKLQDRDKQLYEIEKEKEEKVSKLNGYKNKIEDLFKKINEIIQSKKNECLQDAEELKSWSIQDTDDQLFSKPIQWIYMPLYAMFIENSELMEERMNVFFPGYIGEDFNAPYEEISESFLELKALLNDKIENDMKIRSNFEFSCENKNLIKDLNLKKKIEIGISKLRNKSLIGDQIEAKIKENLNLIL